MKFIMQIFSAGLDNLTHKQQRDDEAVLDHLRKTKLFSGFEASENETIATTMTRLCKNRITTDPDSQYPWLTVTHIDGVAL